MRPSNRERIVAGALEIIAREGIDALNFEALAEEVGLTRGGIVYHSVRATTSWPASPPTC